METVTDQIRSITSKTGPDKDGGTWTRFVIETWENGYLVTFNPNLVQVCAEACRLDKPLQFSYQVYGNYKRLERVLPVRKAFYRSPLDNSST
jgi:hypothetical protein